MIYTKSRKGCIKTRSTPASFPPGTVKWAIIKCYHKVLKEYHQMNLNIRDLPMRYLHKMSHH